MFSNPDIHTQIKNELISKWNNVFENMHLLGTLGASNIAPYRIAVLEKAIPIVRFFSDQPSIQFIYDPNFATSSTLLSFFDNIESRLDLFEIVPN
ncbi:hypothetical protein RCL1_008062 [Eukaryota sp. TZLM3-RCL]